MATIKVLILFFVSLFLSFAVWAKGADAVVKISSNFQGGHFQPRLGSGLLISLQGRHFVLTSDHVVYHSNQGIDHTITDAFGQAQKAIYLVSDPGKGLALLSIPEVSKNSIVHPYVPATSKLNKSQAITLAGYPASAADILISDGEVNDLNKPSELFAQVFELIEVVSAHAEFGMSGGAAFSDDGVFRGVLSHQKETDIGSSILLIPEAVVSSWLKDLFNEQGELRSPSPITLAQDPSQQVSDFISYRSGFLYMTQVHPSALNDLRGIEVLLSKSSVSENLYAAAVLNPAQEYLKRIPDARLRALYFRRGGFGGTVIRASDKFVLNIRALQDPNLEPLWEVRGYDTKAPLAEADAVRTKIVQDLQGTDFSSSPHLYTFILRVTQMLEGQRNWQQIKPRDIGTALSDTALQSEWLALQRSSSGKNLRSHLERLHKTFQALTF